MSEIITAKEAHKKGLTIIDLIRRINTDGTIANPREWPPRTIVKAWHNIGNRAETILAQTIGANRPIQFIGFWGAGDKLTPDLFDDEFLRELQILQTSSAEIYTPGMEIILLLADIHAGFNGYQSAEKYLEEIGSKAKQTGITTMRLSRLYDEFGLIPPASDQPIDASSDTYQVWIDPKYDRQRKQLVESAARHHQNGFSPEDAAYWYFVMRTQEKESLARVFSQALMFANTSPDLGGWLLPNKLMPILYLRTLPPWFQNGTY